MRDDAAIALEFTIAFNRSSLPASFERTSQNSWIEVPRADEKDDIANELAKRQVGHASDKKESLPVHHDSELQVA